LLALGRKRNNKKKACAVKESAQKRRKAPKFLFSKGEKLTEAEVVPQKNFAYRKSE
jgi:hypothetical protein